MKKYITLILSIFFLSGCSTQPEKPNLSQQIVNYNLLHYNRTFDKMERENNMNRKNERMALENEKIRIENRILEQKNKRN
jgi:uncharacterized protein YcfL